MNIPLTIPTELAQSVEGAEERQWTQSLLDLFDGIKAKMKVFSASANLTRGGFRVLTECMYPNESFIEVDILLQEDGTYTVSDEGRTVKMLQSIYSVWSQAQDWDVYMRSAIVIAGLTGLETDAGCQSFRVAQEKVFLPHIRKDELPQAILLLANAAARSSYQLMKTWNSPARSAVERMERTLH